MRIVISSAKGELRKAYEKASEPIAEAATAAMKEAGAIAKREARAEIKGAGFTRRWQNTLRVDYYPKRRNSINPAAHIWHKIPYAGIFEEGGTIPGPLWLPLPPVEGTKINTPKRFIAAGGRLIKAKSPRGTPLLIGQLAGETKRVPLFFGVTSVNIPDKFGIKEVVQRAAAHLRDLYYRNLKNIS